MRYPRVEVTERWLSRHSGRPYDDTALWSPRAASSIDRLLAFLTKQDPPDRRQVVFQGLQTLFSYEPPSNKLLEEIIPLRTQVAALADAALQPDLVRSGAGGALAVDAVHALALLGGMPGEDEMAEAARLAKDVHAANQPALTRVVRRRLKGIQDAWKDRGEGRAPRLVDALLSEVQTRGSHN